MSIITNVNSLRGYAMYNIYNNTIAVGDVSKILEFCERDKVPYALCGNDCVYIVTAHSDEFGLYRLNGGGVSATIYRNHISVEWWAGARPLSGTTLLSPTHHSVDVIVKLKKIIESISKSRKGISVVDFVCYTNKGRLYKKPIESSMREHVYKLCEISCIRHQWSNIRTLRVIKTTNHIAGKIEEINELFSSIKPRFELSGVLADSVKYWSKKLKRPNKMGLER